MAQGELPSPNYEQEALQDLLAQSIETGTVLRNAGFDDEAEQLRLKTLIEVTNRAYATVRTLGLQAIAEGRMSRVGLSRVMGVHQGTVARWAKGADAQEPLNAVEPNREAS